MRMAIVADWLTTFGGAEHVIDAWHRLWPDAPIFTTVVRRGKLGPIDDADIRCDSRLQCMYRIMKRHQWLLPWMPAAIERIDLSMYDTVVSSSHAVAKGIIPPAGTRHVCYCHTPMRYAWEMEEEYLHDFRMRGLRRRMIKAELSRLRRWDIATAKRVDLFIANSPETQERIRRMYGRDSIIIPPPVHRRFFDEPLKPRDSAMTQSCNLPFLAFGRLVPYKRFDLLIELANRCRLPLVIAGSGDDAARLRSLAGPTITFLGRVEDADLPSLYMRSRALLFPQHEDAGIVLMEAQACGLPVIAYGRGGAKDVVVENISGILVHEQSVRAFADAIEAFRARQWSMEEIRTRALKFREENFCTSMTRIIAQHATNLR